jgi:arginyl-tRNA synthetase
MEEAVRRAGEKYEQSLQERIQQGYEVPELTELQRREVAEVVGLGALKYADLSSNRVNNYEFSYEKMLATVGNTATYMQYAYARCKNILRKQGLEGPPAPLAAAEVLLEAPEERDLGLLLLRFPEFLAEAVQKYEPHHLANYLWDLSRAANKFYDRCPVLTAETPALKTSRLWLVWQTGRTIQQTLSLLGIQTVERM